MATDSCGILLVIPCLNEESHIAAVIEAALQDQDRYRLLVVVADGGSTDRTRRIVGEMAATRPNLRLLDNPLKVQSAGVNLAARLFGEGRQWLVRMDAHAEYPDHYVSLLVAEAERTKAASVVVAMRSEGKDWFQKAVATAQNSLLGAGGSAHRRDGKAGFVDHGHHALFDLPRFLALRGYDEAQSHNEDAEFDVRLARAGGRIWLTREAAITYYPRARMGDLYRQYRNYGRGRALTILRHHTRPKIRQLLPAAVLPSVLLLPFAHWVSWAAAPISLWIAACLFAGAALGLRARHSYGFASGFAAMIIHIAWSIGFWRALFSAGPAPEPLRCKQEAP